MPARAHLRLAIVLPLLLAAACDDGARPARTSARDSTAVRVVDNPADTRVERWALEARPEMEIARPDSLPPVVSAVRFRDGFAVIDRWEEPIRFHDAAGRRGPNVGAEDRFGPAMVTWIGRLPGDSLGAWDPDAREMTVYTPQGRFARTLSAADVPALAVVGPRVRGVYANGALLLTADEDTMGPPGRAWRPARRVVRVAADGSATVLATVPGDARISHVFRRADEARTLAYDQPLGPRTSVVPVGDAIYVGTGETYEIRRIAPGGDTLVIRRHATPRPVTPEDRAAVTADLLLMPDTALHRRRAADAVWPAAWPAYHAFLADPAGNLWVADHQGMDAWARASQWSVFAPDGRWIATVTGPARFRATEVGDGWVLGVHRAADGTEHVRLHRLNRPGSAAPRA